MVVYYLRHGPIMIFFYFIVISISMLVIDSFVSVLFFISKLVSVDHIDLEMCPFLQGY